MKTDVFEFGIGTRRRPIGPDYAAAKDAECGIFSVPPLSGINYIPPADFTIEASQINK